VSARRSLAWCGGVAAVAVLAAILGTALGTDYALCAPGELCTDDPAYAIRALSLGDFHAFFANQTTQGLVAMVVRLPLAGPVYATGGSELWAYRLGALACLIPVAVLGTWLSSYARTWLDQLLVVLLPVAMVVLAGVLHFGHPEEALGGVLCVVAVLLAARGRAVPAGTLVALAVATKSWGLLAVPVCVVALPRPAWLRFALTVISTTILTTAPLLIADPDRFVAAHRLAAHPYHVSPFDVWWRLAGTGARRSLPASIDWLPRTLILATGLGSALVWATRKTRAASDPLMLLAFVLVLRGALDASACAYYYVPALLALMTSEVIGGRRPVMSLAGTALVAAMQAHERLGPAPSDDLYNAVYVVGLLLLAAAAGRAAFRSAGAAIV
jgi:hypothetical protein